MAVSAGWQSACLAIRGLSLLHDGPAVLIVIVDEPACGPAHIAPACTRDHEVVERTEGFLVRQRCLDSQAVDEAESRLFRTAAVAFRFAEMSACFDRYTARIAGEEAESELSELGAQQKLFEELSRRLMDEGMAAIVLDAWARADEERDRRRYH
jgi:hypothetical protein